MANKFEVKTAYLEQLALEQEEAAVEIDSAMATTDGLAYKLVWDHGLISAAFWGVMFNTESEREAACTNMASVCADLAGKLRASATAYTSTDTQTSDNLDQQMLPG
ncbi:hypothetical protein AWC29_23055 [Mycobacterium triplex]|uniref:ESX-1 secretion-associated protein EspC n=1 Tax=Mycobacterium triplex TaxID=47839 RepID=A0A024K1J5_9MYCO|nr:type VII secretion target [Mycobacterium triplex]ORX01527.1 hypothetical protein AWC29_23055 [Mycobacterium triplex]CDO89669.1 hypothetical protein BN973_04049 [Mycobacterium triplex]